MKTYKKIMNGVAMVEKADSCPCYDPDCGAYCG